MPLTMRPTGGHSLVYADRQDLTSSITAKPVGRIYEDASASTAAEGDFVGTIAALSRVRRCLDG